MSIKKYEVLLQTADLGSFTKASEVSVTHSPPSVTLLPDWRTSWV